MRFFCTTFALVTIAILLSGAAHAAEPTESEVLLEKLKELETTKSRSLAKRWEGLIRLRQWKSASGKHTTYAKYVAHTPDMSSVKLLVTIREGSERREKLVDVPIGKLDKDAQVLLKRIASAREAVEELVGTAEAVDEAAAQERPTADSVSSKSEEPDYYPAPRGAGKKKRKPHITSRPIAIPRQLPEFHAPHLPDNAPWRTNYKEFIKHLSSVQINPEGDRDDITNTKLNWGELQALRWQWEYASLEIQARTGELSLERQRETQKQADESRLKLGEVVWTAALKEDLPTSSEVEIEFDLPKPNIPFRIAFFLDDDYPRSSRQLKKGDQVKFIGRFKSIGMGTPTILVHVRFPYGEQGQEHGSEGNTNATPPAPLPK